MAGIPTTRNPSVPLDSEERSDEETPNLTDSESEVGDSCPPPPVSPWRRVKSRKRSRRAQACPCCPRKQASTSPPVGSAPSGESSGEGKETRVSPLISVRTESLAGLGQKVEEFEELEFMVDSGAGHTVVSPEQVKAVKASDPDVDQHYKLADGSLMPHKGEKVFQAATEDYMMHTLKAQVTDVDSPLLSVSQVVLGGHEVVFRPESQGGSYISLKGGKYTPGKKLPLRLDGNVYRLM